MTRADAVEKAARALHHELRGRYSQSWETCCQDERDDSMRLVRLVLAAAIPPAAPSAPEAKGSNMPADFDWNPPAPDDKPARDVLLYALRCALAWDPAARVQGNLRAGDLARALKEVLATPSPTAPDAAGGVVGWSIRGEGGDYSDDTWLTKAAADAECVDWNTEKYVGHPFIVVPLYAHLPLDAVHVARMHEALSIVAKAAGYETAWLAPSGTPNIILERKHPTEAGKIQITRLDIAVSPAVEVARRAAREAFRLANERKAVIGHMGEYTSLPEATVIERAIQAATGRTT